MSGSIARDVHLSLRTNLAPLANAKLRGLFPVFSSCCHNATDSIAD